MTTRQGTKDTVAIRSVQLEHRHPMRTLISLQGGSSPNGGFVDLTGRPSPALEGRHVDLEPKRVTPGGALGDDSSGAVADQLHDQGVLVEATVLTGGENPTIRLVWFGGFGETSLILHECATSLTPGDTLNGDSESERRKRQNVVSEVRKWLQGWTPGFDETKPPLTFEETIEGEIDESDRVPLAEMLGAFNYAPVTDLPAQFLEGVALGELAKLAQLQQHVHPCEHARLPHLYVYLTTNLIPKTRISRRLPYEHDRGSYLYGEDCPECAIRGALKQRGSNFDPPHGPQRPEDIAGGRLSRQRCGKLCDRSAAQRLRRIFDGLTRCWPSDLAVLGQ